MTELSGLIGKLLAEVLDIIDQDDDSAIVRVEVSSGRALDEAPPVCHEFSLRVVAGEWQASGRSERWGLPGTQGETAAQ